MGGICLNKLRRYFFYREDLGDIDLVWGEIRDQKKR
ncbi:hypothetical protein [Helicobacter suis]